MKKEGFEGKGICLCLGGWNLYKIKAGWRENLPFGDDWSGN